MAQSLSSAIDQIASAFAAERRQRQARRQLEQADFDRIRDAGYLLTVVPEHEGGLWRGIPGTVRLLCESLRTLAQGDASVALVAAMHPAVVSYWLCLLPEAEQHAFLARQIGEVTESSRQGTWWGTVTSEPGSGGDVLRTRAVARRAEGDHHYLLSGEKHFGSGSGILDRMVTTAVAEGDDEPDWFWVAYRDVPWDGSAGARLVAEWDGHGMTATQSHGLRFESFPATRIALPGQLTEIARRTGGFIGCLFTAVIAGVVDAAVAAARGKLSGRELSPHDAVQWQRAQLDHWLLKQALEGMITAVESLADPRRDCLQGKTACAELAESCLTRICRVIGGGAYHRDSPFGHWLADVRALGYLRPPWGLAYDGLIASEPPPGGEAGGSGQS